MMAIPAAAYTHLRIFGSPFFFIHYAVGGIKAQWLSFSARCATLGADYLIQKEKPMTTVQDRIRDILTREFAPAHLDVIDDSHKHAGHAGARPEGETHFRVIVVSEAFTGESRVTRQRRINAALKELLETRIHALQLKALTPEEHTN